VSVQHDGSVLLGPNYYVVSCKCYLDKSLTKGRLEWCEWCRCPECGGKQNKTNERGYRDNSTLTGLFSMVSDLNAELALFFGIIGVSVWSIVYIQDYLYRVQHIIGLYSFLFLLHAMFLYFGF
jgi:hypothetical protein